MSRGSDLPDYLGRVLGKGLVEGPCPSNERLIGLCELGLEICYHTGRKLAYGLKKGIVISVSVDYLLPHGKGGSPTPSSNVEIIRASFMIC